MRNFITLIIWTKGIELTKAIYQISKNLLEDEKFGLQSQIRKSAVSIPSNIAENCNRNTDLEYKRFLEIAMGSAFEVENQLIIACEIDYLNLQEIETVFAEITRLEKQINALINQLK